MKIQKKDWFYDVPNQRIPVYIYPSVFRGWQKFCKDYRLFRQTFLAINKNIFETRVVFLALSAQKEVDSYYFTQLQESSSKLNSDVLVVIGSKKK